VAALERMTVAELRPKYAEVFGEGTGAADKVWLRRRIASRVQANVDGELTDRAMSRAATLAPAADLRVNPPAAGVAMPVRGATRPVGDRRHYHNLSHPMWLGESARAGLCRVFLANCVIEIDSVEKSCKIGEVSNP